MANDNLPSSLDYFPWNIPRFNRSAVVREMDGFERGIYLQLLGEEWMLQCRGLQPEEWRLQATACLSPEQWALVRDKVLGAFSVSDGSNGMEKGRLYHPTCEEAIALALSQRDTSRENGKLGGRPKKKKGNGGKSDE